MRGLEGVEFWGQMSMLKAGLQFADAITTVSPTYARETQQVPAGFGLDGVLRAQAAKLSGILNGIDPGVWNPETDALIARQYGPLDVAEGKAANAAALRELCGLHAHEGGMLFGLVSRLTDQKGVDLVVAAAPELTRAGGQLVVPGSGDPALQRPARP